MSQYTYLPDNQLVSIIHESLLKGDITKLVEIECPRTRIIYRRLNTTTIKQLPSSSLVYLQTHGHLDIYGRKDIPLPDITHLIRYDSKTLSHMFGKTPIRYRSPMPPADLLSIEEPEKLRYIFRAIEPKQVESLAVQYECRLTDLYHQLVPTILDLHDLEDPDKWITDWCPHCREKLLPYDRCISRSEDINVIIRTLDSIPQKDHPRRLIDYFFQHQMFTYEHVFRILDRYEKLRPYIPTRQNSLPKIPYPDIYMYYEEYDQCYQVFPEKLRHSHFKSYPQLVRRTTHDYWVKNYDQMVHKLSTPVIRQLAIIHPNILYHHHETMVSRHLPEITQLILQVMETLISEHDTNRNSYWSKIDQHTIEKIFYHAYRQQTQTQSTTRVCSLCECDRVSVECQSRTHCVYCCECEKLKVSRWRDVEPPEWYDTQPMCFVSNNNYIPVQKVESP
jgi:hypothetical protein